MKPKTGRRNQQNSTKEAKSDSQTSKQYRHANPTQQQNQHQPQQANQHDQKPTEEHMVSSNKQQQSNAGLLVDTNQKENTNKTNSIEIECKQESEHIKEPDSQPTATKTSDTVIDMQKSSEKIESSVEETIATIQQPVATTFPEVSNNQDDLTSMSDTLTVLHTSNGSEVYIVGTAHFSTKSAQDVRKVVRTVKPSAIVLELCQERAHMLEMDEQSLLEQNRNLSFEKIREAIAQKGLAQGLIYVTLIKLSATLTQSLGMAPGSEFRAGASEARAIGNCRIVLGDRSLRVTVARAVASISLWQKLKLVYQAAKNDLSSITQEDVENCKEKDILERLLEELGGEFPGFKRTLLDERNIYLAHSIYTWAEHSEPKMVPKKLVAVVGIGHVGGIVENWGKTTDEQVYALNEVPKTSMTVKIVSKSIKYGSLALLIYVGYRAFTPTSVQTTISETIQAKISNWRSQ